ncbi:methylamine utilization protein [Sphaerotilus sulfidivorans]
MRAARRPCHAPVRSSCRLVDASALPAGGRSSGRIADGQRRRRQRPAAGRRSGGGRDRGAARTAAAGTRAEVVQRQRNFEPGVLVVQTGTQVDFPNQDTVRHHVYSFSPVKTFEIKLYAGRPAAPVLFDRAGVITLGCNIHDQMIAHVVMVDTPLFGRTDAAGRLVLEVPAGEHRLRAWHPDMREGLDLQAQPLRVGTSPVAAAVRLPVQP